MATTKDKFTCFCCGKDYVETNYYTSHSDFFASIGKIPYCKQCFAKIYQKYYETYLEKGYLNPEKAAIKRICMAFDIFFSEDAYNHADKRIKTKNVNISYISEYIRQLNLGQYKGETYDTTLAIEREREFSANVPDAMSDTVNIDERDMEFFGMGFAEEDYKFLRKEYDDWVARHECNTKAQEEIFKRICFKQLEIQKATRMGEDTKNLDVTFQNYLDTAKLKPKQNSGDTTADNQTFGTLIDKWENTRPLPEIDEELRDVDKIAWYIDIFYRGHLSRMMGLKNGLSNLYSKFMKKYTVEKPEYSDDENSEVLFDAIFGNQSLDSDNEQEVV